MPITGGRITPINDTWHSLHARASRPALCAGCSTCCGEPARSRNLLELRRPALRELQQGIGQTGQQFQGRDDLPLVGTRFVHAVNDALDVTHRRQQVEVERGPTGVPRLRGTRPFRPACPTHRLPSQTRTQRLAHRAASSSRRSSDSAALCLVDEPFRGTGLIGFSVERDVLVLRDARGVLLPQLG